MSKLVIKGKNVPIGGVGRNEPNVASEPLTSEERKKLDELEKEIGKSLLTFINIGKALEVIRDQRLYRENYNTFEDYCRNYWEFSRQRAHQLIAAALLAESLSTQVDVVPTNEAQVRPMLSLSLDQAKDAWQKAKEIAGEKQISRRIVQQAVETICTAGVPAAGNDADSKIDTEQGSDTNKSDKIETPAAALQTTAPDEADLGPIIDTPKSAKETSEADSAKRLADSTEQYVEAELIGQTTEESFELADGTRSDPISFSASGDVITAKDLAGKLRKMAENNSKANDDHRKEDTEIAGRQAPLIELADAVNRIARRSTTDCVPGRIYWAVDELLHLVTHLRPATTHLK